MIPALIFQNPPALSAKDFAARCAELRQAQDWKGLEALARAQVSAEPKDSEAMAALGSALLGQNRISEARAVCERAIKLDWHDVEAYLYLGLVCAQAQDRDGVIQTGRQLALAQPFDMPRYYKLATIVQAVAGPGLINLHPKVSSAEVVPYPPEAMMFRTEGAVALEVEVSEAGVPALVEVLAGPKVLVSNATQTLRTQKYEPMLEGGRTVKYRTVACFTYRTGPNHR